MFPPNLGMHMCIIKYFPDAWISSPAAAANVLVNSIYLVDLSWTMLLCLAPVTPVTSVAPAAWSSHANNFFRLPLKQYCPNVFWF